MAIQTVGFVGLGAMGTPMAWNVDDAGFDLRVYNRTREKTTPFADEGIAVASSPHEVADGADAVVVMVTGPEALLDVVTGPDGLVAGLDEGATVVNTSTVSQAATREAAAAVEAVGGRFVDAPVAGTLPSAESGTLTVLAAGDDEDLAAVDPLLSAMGDPVVDCGDLGQGTAMKLAVNLLLGDMMQAFAEMLTFGTEQGLDFETMRTVVESGGLDAPLFRAKADLVERGDFSPFFPVDLLFKDLNLALDAAGDTETPLPATAATREAVNATRALGHGDEDMAAVVKYLEETTGTRVGRE